MPGGGAGHQPLGLIEAVLPKSKAAKGVEEGERLL